jgi:hypothetical protein
MITPLAVRTDTVAVILIEATLFSVRAIEVLTATAAFKRSGRIAVLAINGQTHVSTKDKIVRLAHYEGTA